MSNSLFIGRWQPFHEGHQKLIGKVLDEGGSVVIAVRDTPISESNPYTVEDRIKRIEDHYKENERVQVISIPDIKDVCYGRDVGWGVRRIRLDSQTEEISATKTRNSKKRVIWLTGNVGAGKTTIAYLLKERLNGIVLDGDEMRHSISTDLGFSPEDREEHNLRVAKLAKMLNAQGYNVIVSVIAPFASTREKIRKIIEPYWIYIKSDVKDPDKPYEPPKHADITIDPSEESVLQSMERIVKEVGNLAEITSASS